MLRTATKRISAYLLLLLAAIPLIYILIVRVQQQSIRHRMKERLEANDLHSVTISENDVHWINNGKELLINGRLFDVWSSHLRNGVYVFSGLYDEEETSFLGQIQKDQQNNNGNSKQLAQLFQLLQSFYNNTPEEIVLPENNPGSKFISGSPALVSQYISIFSPPPQAS